MPRRSQSQTIRRKMERRAILIDYSPQPPPGTRREGDLNAFRDFLSSPFGGSWEKGEITSLDHVAPTDLQKAVGAATSADFALLLIVAAGEEAKMGRPWAEVQVDTSVGTLSERQLNPGCPRCLMLLDCVGLQQSAPDQPRFATLPSDQARAKYDGALCDAEAGLVKVFAPRAENAVSLTWALMQVSRDWTITGSGVLSVDQAVERVQRTHNENLHAPSVKYIGGRRIRDFPFCVV
jgi:hypothetical protein